MGTFVGRACGWLTFGLAAGVALGNALAFHFVVPPWAWWASLEHMRAWVAILVSAGVAGAAVGVLLERCAA